MSNGCELRNDVCDRCGESAEHLVILQANYLKAHRDRRPLCDNCLKLFGEWWRSTEASETTKEKQ